MKTEMLNYFLPPELIAQQPAGIRSESKLLVLSRTDNSLEDAAFSRITDFLTPGDCLVLNDTKVLPARFFAQRQTGGRLEGLFLNETTPGTWQVMLKNSRKIKPAETIQLMDKTGAESPYTARLLEKTSGGKCTLKINTPDEVGTVLEKVGFPPLPPYIKRCADPEQARIDRLRYQSVYARKSGAVAAPTAGLHFTVELLDKLKKDGIRFAYITLHVGAGTFKPVTADELENHRIHEENFTIDAENARVINLAREKGNRIIAVGTTSVRTLETACSEDSTISAASGSTRLFITPGYKFKIVDAMITNFHLPKSTLLALVAAFAGLENVQAAYRHALKKRYRFYSYGDAMLIT